MLNISLAAVLSSDSGAGSGEPGQRNSESKVLSRDELLGEDGPSTDDEMYLFPEERVLVLLDEYDGRMWQGEVVEETGFSKAKVSKLLTSMEDDGDVDRYWKNGKKVVTLPGLAPDPSE